MDGASGRGLRGAAHQSVVPATEPYTNPRRARARGWSQGRKNTSRACDDCRRKKIRCSGNQPCVRCIRYHLPCEYKLPYLRGRQPPSQRTLGSSTTPRSGRHLLPESLQSHQTEASGIDSSNLILNEVPSRQSPAIGLVNDDSQYLGPTAGETFIRRAWKRINRERRSIQRDGHDTSFSRVYSSASLEGESSLLGAVIPPRMTYHRAMTLVTFYFDCAMISYRFLDSHSVKSWVGMLYAEDAANSDDCWQVLGPYKSSILFMIFATGLRYMEGSGDIDRHGSPSSQIFFLAARQSLRNQAERHQLETVQARLAYSLYLLATSKLEWSWYVLGRTVQMITALGIHRKKDGFVSTDSGYMETQLIRRCFWTAYALDRYVSVIVGRPRLIVDSLFDQLFPDRIDDDHTRPVIGNWDTPMKFTVDCRMDYVIDCSLDASYFTVKLAQIVGEISLGIYPLKAFPKQVQVENSARLTRKLLELWDNLPPSLGLVHPNSLSDSLRRRAIELRIAFNYAIILANRPFLLRRYDIEHQGTDGGTNAFGERARTGVHAARTVITLWDSIAKERSVFGAFWITHHAVFSAISVLYVYIILSYGSRYGGQETGIAVSGADTLTTDDEELFLLAQLGHEHLGNAVEINQTCLRYDSVLEELREEAKKQISSADCAMPVGEHAIRTGDNVNYTGTDVSRAENGTTGHVPVAFGLPNLEDESLIRDWSTFDSLIYLNPENNFFDTAYTS